MLTYLCVENIALVEGAEIEFSNGLNVVSGETGAGKTVLLRSLMPLFGWDKGSGKIRSGSDKAVITAVFDVSGRPEIFEILEDAGHDIDGTLIIRKIIKKQQKSRVFINDKLSTVELTRRLGEELIQISGQHEHQKLLRPSQHIKLVDSFGDDCFKELMLSYEEKYAKRSELKKAYEELVVSPEEREREADMLEHQIKEIRDAEVEDGEMTKLIQRKELAKHSAVLKEAVNRARYLLVDSEGCALETIGEAVRALDKACSISDELNAVSAELGLALESISENDRRLREISQSIEVDMEEIEIINSRIAKLQGLLRRYGPTERDVIGFLEKALKRSEYLYSIGKSSREMEKRIVDIEESMLAEGKKISNLRRAMALQLEQRVAENLAELNMQSFEIAVSLKPRKELTDTGIDDCEIVMKPSKSSDYQSVKTAASGGELSRLMLSLRLAALIDDAQATLLFDEVDAGVGGITANALALRLSEIAKQNQVICITHLPQVAALADTHYTITRHDSEEETKTSANRLDKYEDRIREIARMLGGGKSARELAKEMIKNKG